MVVAIVPAIIIGPITAIIPAIIVPVIRAVIITVSRAIVSRVIIIRAISWVIIRVIPRTIVKSRNADRHVEMDTGFRLLRHDREQAECDHREEKISFHSKYSLP